MHRPQLEWFYFPLPPVSVFLDPESMFRAEFQLNRDSPSDKIQDLFSRFEGYLMEMVHQQWVHRLISSIPVLSQILLRVGCEQQRVGGSRARALIAPPPPNPPAFGSGCLGCWRS